MPTEAKTGFPDTPNSWNGVCWLRQSPPQLEGGSLRHGEWREVPSPMTLQNCLHLPERLSPESSLSACENEGNLWLSGLWDLSPCFLPGMEGAIEIYRQKELTHPLVWSPCYSWCHSCCIEEAHLPPSGCLRKIRTQTTLLVSWRHIRNLPLEWGRFMLALNGSPGAREGVLLSSYGAVIRLQNP